MTRTTIMAWAVVAGILVVLCAFGSSANVEVDWNSRTFSQSKNHKVVFVKIGDTLEIICPHGKDAMFESMWMVDYRDFISCNASCANYTRVTLCDTPRVVTMKQLKVTERQGKPESNVNFARGSMHFFIAPSRGKSHSLSSRAGGHCRSHNMKIAVYVCDLPKDTSCGECSLPLGLEDGRIKSHQISASLESDDKHQASYARLQSSSTCLSERNSWCVSKSLDVEHYIQYDLKYIHLLSGIATQGSPHSPRWVTRYHLTYSFDGKDWTRQKAFSGNTDPDSVVRHWFKPRFHARSLRIRPEAWNGAICLRAEIYGCRVEGIPSTLPQKASLFVSKEKFSAQDEHRVLCGSNTCHPYSTCNVKSGKPHCTCAMQCKDGGKVCGSDGYLYDNICKLKKTACEKNKKVRVVKSNKCAAKSDTAVLIDSKEDNSLDLYITLVFSCLLLLSVIGIFMFAAIIVGWIRDK